VIEEILPAEVVAVEAMRDWFAITLFEEEEVAIGRAVEKRRREFGTGRACARLALMGLGFPCVSIPAGASGEPRWPRGVVGSITHCTGYRACAVAPAEKVGTVGIDAEPNEPLGDSLLDEIASAEEQSSLSALSKVEPAICWDRLLFSAKESVYKAWFPLARRWLGFEDVVVTVDPSACTFRARLLVAGPSPGGLPLTGFSGRWLVRDGLVLTAIAVANPACAPSRSVPVSTRRAPDQRERIKERSDPATSGTVRP
jgi:4'-phosphopantetheinyl transferase EntD